jgi:stage II sporulation protein AB (anti-sigma F factor)
MNNEMKMEFDAISVNEGFARLAVASFIASLNPTMEELSDIKTAVSEAVTNPIIHGYENMYGYGKHGDKVPAYVTIHPGKIYMHCKVEDTLLYIEIQDKGKGIEDLEKAMEPLYTTKPEYNRSGMGFAFMEAFMDDLEVISEPGMGTLVKMQKKIGSGSWIEAC